MSDKVGQARALTILVPIRAGEADELRAYLRGLERGPDSPLAVLSRLHLARWVVIDRLPSDASHPDVLPAPQLLFTCCVDGDAKAFARELPAALGPMLDDIWGACEGFSGGADADGFARWLLKHHLPATFFVSAYQDATVSDVHNALAAREQVLAFALSAQDLSKAERLDAFRTAFPT